MLKQIAAAFAVIICISCPLYAAEPKPAYRVGPLDEINLIVWEQPEISKTVSVSDEGSISVPPVGSIFIDGMTLQEVSEKVKKEISGYIESPVVVCELVKKGALHISALGWVKNPGVYALARSSNILDLLAVAGGLDFYADSRNIRIIKRYSKNIVTVNLDDIVSGKQNFDDYMLESGDIVYASGDVIMTLKKIKESIPDIDLQLDVDKTQSPQPRESGDNKSGRTK